MRTAFSELQSEESLKRDGYVIVDLLDKHELARVQEIVRDMEYGQNSKLKLWFSVVQESVERKKEIQEKFYPFFQPAIDRFMQDHKVMRIVIVQKFPGGETVKPHQHANRLDEMQYRTFTAWCPMVDTTIEMGTLHVLKGSHTVFTDHIRTYNDFTTFHGISQGVLDKYSTPVQLKAGQSVIFDDRLIHWSPPNNTSKTRTVIQLHLIPRETETDITIYYRDNKSELSRYKINPEAFQNVALSQERPDKMIPLGKVRQRKFIYNDRQFIAKMQDAENPDPGQKNNLLQRLFDLRLI